MKFPSFVQFMARRIARNGGNVRQCPPWWQSADLETGYALSLWFFFGWSAHDAADRSNCARFWRAYLTALILGSIPTSKSSSSSHAL